MTTLSGTSLLLTDTIFDTPALGFQSPSGITSAIINGTTYVYATSIVDDTIQVATLSADGQLTPVAVINDAVDTGLDGAYYMRTFTIGSTQFLAVTGQQDDAVTIYSLSDTGPFLTRTDAVFDSDGAGYNLDGATDIEVLSVGGQTYLYVSGAFEDGISVFSVSGSGVLTHVQDVNDSGALELYGVYGLDSFSLGGLSYVTAAGSGDDGISVFQVNSGNGQLISVANYDGATQGILDGAAFASAQVIDGTAFLYVPEYGNTNALTVLSFDGTTITQVQRIVSDSFLEGPFHAEIIEAGDRIMLAVTGHLGGTLAFFEIDTTPLSPTLGGLTPLDVLSDNAGEGYLNLVWQGFQATVGNTDFLLVTAANDHAINVYEIGGGDDEVTGSNRADDLSGGSGDDTLIGLGGDDEMAGGSGDDVLSGGSGDDALAGNDGSDDLFGGSGNDTMMGDAGDDDLTGGSGNDSLGGGDGADALIGDAGDDFARGDAGSDWFRGGSGSDTLAGNAGEDTLRGGDDDDRMFGGTEADTLAGNTGDDYLRGGTGNDFVYGGTGADNMGGGSGDDYLEGGLGDDLIRGDNDNDTLLGGRGQDTLTGGTGADVFVFNTAADSPLLTRDEITDFEDGVDMIDLSGFAGTLSFVAGYTGTAGEVRYNDSLGRLYIDVDGDLSSDFAVDITGAPTIDENDLIL